MRIVTGSHVWVVQQLLSLLSWDLLDRDLNWKTTCFATRFQTTSDPEEFQSTLFPRTCNIQSCLTKFIKNERLVQNMVSRWRHDDVIGSFLLNRCFSFLSELEVLLMIEIFWTWMGLKLIPTFAPALRRSFLSYELLIADGQRVWVLKCSTLLTTDKYRANFLEHSQL